MRKPLAVRDVICVSISEIRMGEGGRERQIEGKREGEREEVSSLG